MLQTFKLNHKATIITPFGINSRSEYPSLVSLLYFRLSDSLSVRTCLSTNVIFSQKENDDILSVKSLAHRDDRSISPTIHVQFFRHLMVAFALADFHFYFGAKVSPILCTKFAITMLGKLRLNNREFAHTYVQMLVKLTLRCRPLSTKRGQELNGEAFRLLSQVFLRSDVWCNISRSWLSSLKVFKGCNSEWESKCVCVRERMGNYKWSELGNSL